MKIKVLKGLKSLLACLLVSGVCLSFLGVEELKAAEGQVTDFRDFQSILLDYATEYEGKSHEKIFGKGYAIQWCAKYVDRILTDAYTDCGWDTEDSWGAYNDNIGLAPAWARQFEDETYGGYYCWKNWQSNHISHYGYKDSDISLYVPRVGDIVCVNWKPKPNPEPTPEDEVNKNEKDINHMGIIVRVDSLYSIYVSEGNLGTNEDPRFNVVGSRDWTRKSLDKMFETPTGTIIAVCRPKVPDYVTNTNVYELDISNSVCSQEFFKIYYTTNNRLTQTTTE